MVAFAVESESLHFGFDSPSAVVSTFPVAVALGPTRAELHDVFSLQFIFKLSEVFAQRRLLLSWGLGEDDGVDVEVHHALV